MNKCFLLGLALCAVSLCAMEDNPFSLFANRPNADNFLKRKELRDGEKNMNEKRESSLFKSMEIELNNMNNNGVENPANRRLFSEGENE